MADPLFSLEGKVALVTGGSRGLGYQMVKAFAERGADVIIASRKVEACEEVAEEVRAMGRKAIAVGAHCGKWDDIDRLIRDRERLARLQHDALVCHRVFHDNRIHIGGDNVAAAVTEIPKIGAKRRAVILPFAAPCPEIQQRHMGFEHSVHADKVAHPVIHAAKPTRLDFGIHRVNHAHSNRAPASAKDMPLKIC